MILKTLIEMSNMKPSNPSEADFVAGLKEFLASYVCIPKGDNRHPYSDVLHEWIEGVEVECNADIWRKIGSPQTVFTDNEYRIKPSEQVYEWQWYYISAEGTAVILSCFYSNEVVNSWDDGSRFFKIENTKRESK